MIKGKIKTLKSLKRALLSRQRRGEKIVFTNGCFDILHLGHLRYLEQAKSLGDILVVGVNSDSSVKKIKGAARPIQPEKERAALVAALACVDYAVIFSQGTPLALIKALRPDVLVKGGDWQNKDIVGADFVRSCGGRVVSSVLLKDYSTSSIIARIRRGR